MTMRCFPNIAIVAVVAWSSADATYRRMGARIVHPRYVWHNLEINKHDFGTGPLDRDACQRGPCRVSTAIRIPSNAGLPPHHYGVNVHASASRKGHSDDAGPHAAGNRSHSPGFPASSADARHIATVSQRRHLLLPSGPPARAVRPPVGIGFVVFVRVDSAGTGRRGPIVTRARLKSVSCSR